jgi:hypothetical protein
MQENMIFVIGSPRSGSTMLQRMLGSHADIYTHPEPHIVTPLAHLGFYANVEKAPYDHINAAEAIREYVDDLPGGSADYYDACTAYLDVLYGRMIDKSGKKMMLDKTPAYGLVLPFLSRVYKNAKFIVLTRHPLAIFSSYAKSFFDGDYDAALSFNNIVGRYVPALAVFLRQKDVPFYHVKYEDLVKNPEAEMASIFNFLGLPNQEDAVEYGRHSHVIKSFGDPKASQESRPTTKSIDAWAVELANDDHKLELAKQVIEPLSSDDIAIWGYEKNTLFDKIALARGEKPGKDKKWQWNSYRIKRKMLMSLKKDINTRAHGKMIKKIKYYCDVLLRE